ncbi:hypothetical protein [Companilactobacillus ginsenosidimutans]|uniref:Lipoprotein n=1 Tax=Companilactobacillus ginsenosidimutans TaxID=1007676 RepID=A0A0H4QHN5_9LACO|nr:hypothetical protein [Companilactobacillus ginsenosidimutans]AKP67899.1 hypothetical protein ABM34_10405 [Companilactobacillus ginsenosidimutans]
MKKVISLIIIILLIFPLAACGNNSKKVSANDSYKKSITKLNTSKMDENEQAWNEKIKTAKIETISTSNNGAYTRIPTSMSELKKYNPTLIKGTVYNLQTMTGEKNEAQTKVAVYVDKVINGDKRLQNSFIYFNLNSGFIYKPDQKDFNYLKRAETPMPAIGSQIITGITLRDINPKKKDPVTTFFLSNGATGNNFYIVDDPYYAFWIKKPGADEFKLNNPFLTRKLKDDWYADKLLNLTDKLNQAENK